MVPQKVFKPYASTLFIMVLNHEIRIATGFKCLRVNYWEINLVTLKCLMDFLEKTFKERSKTEKVNITIGFYIFETV